MNFEVDQVRQIVSGFEQKFSDTSFIKKQRNRIQNFLEKELRNVFTKLPILSFFINFRFENTSKMILKMTIYVFVKLYVKIPWLTFNENDVIFPLFQDF